MRLKLKASAKKILKSAEDTTKTPFPLTQSGILFIINLQESHIDVNCSEHLTKQQKN